MGRRGGHAKSLDANVETADTECPRHGGYSTMLRPKLNAGPIAKRVV